MQITKEAIKKATHQILYGKKTQATRECVTNIILSHCTETEDEPTYACTDGFADKVLESDDVHKECAEECYFVHYPTIDEKNRKKSILVPWVEGQISQVEQILARHFPNHQEMKEALAKLLPLREYVQLIQKDDGTNYYRCCGWNMIVGHSDDCPFTIARTALGLEGK